MGTDKLGWSAVQSASWEGFAGLLLIVGAVNSTGEDGVELQANATAFTATATYCCTTLRGRFHQGNAKPTVVGNFDTLIELRDGVHHYYWSRAL